MAIEVFDTPVQTYWKCLKYVTLGNEDSLIGYVKYLSNYRENCAITEKVLVTLRLGRQDYKKIQAWTDGNGKLENLIVIGHNDEVMHNIVVDSSQV
jgi:hypothetical protein